MWYLSRRVTQSNLKAWAVTMICFLLPDMALSQQVMVENLTYPLIAMVFLLAHRSFCRDGKHWEIYLVAVLCALLYFAKPGLIAVGISLCLVYWYLCLVRQNDRIRLKQAIAFTLTLIAVLSLLRLLTQYGLGVDYTIRSIYQQQMQPISVQHLTLALQGMLLYAFFFPACCLVLPIAVPLSFQSKLDAPDRQLLRFTLLSLGIVIMGIAYIIYVDEVTANPLAARIHIRYIAAFIPMILMHSLSNKLSNLRLNRSLFISLAFIASCVAILTAAAFLSNRKYPVDALILSPIAENWLSLQTKPLFTISLLFGLLTSGWYLYVRGWTPKAQIFVTFALAGWMLLGNVSGYDMMMHNRGADWAADATQVTEAMKDKPFVFVAEDGGFFWNAATALDMRMKREVPFVELDDLIANTGQGGSYHSFLPKAYWTEIPSYQTGQQNALVMNNALLSRIVIYPSALLQPTGNGHYVMLTIPAGQHWIHSAFSGFENNGWVRKGSKLTIFDDALNSQQTIIVSLYLYALEENTELVVASGSYTKSIPISTEYMWARLEVPVSSNLTTLHFSSTKPVYIQTYTLQ